MQKLRAKLLAVVLHPAVLALPVSLFFILVLPDVFDKYTISLVSEKIMSPGSIMEYHDLDHDGNSEKFLAGDNEIGGSCVVVHNLQSVLYHWNFDGQYLPNKMKTMVGDLDNDGYDEIYAFTRKGDSLVINAIDARKRKQAFTCFSLYFSYTIPNKYKI